MQNEEYASFLKALKQKNDIVEVLGSYIKLERRGGNYWACCPFHHEKTPSFSVNGLDGFYHCFGCGVSGDVISFIKEYENVDFPQAVQILAKRAGLEVPSFDEKESERAAEKKAKRDRCLEVLSRSAKFYLSNLYSGRADKYLEYLSRRKISPSVAKKFGLGASLDFQSLPAYLRDLGYTEEEMLDSGACQRGKDGRLYDFEAERLIFPIINQMDEVIAFGGRVMEKTDFGKYKNTRDTMIFDKRKNLYNINLVKKQRRLTGIDSIIMVEGYMDTISLYQAGITNVVASMGTSLTKEQARLCKRYTDNVFISYDGDFAGQKANLRGLDILKEEGLRVRVVPMPDGLDPDDVARTQGAEGYQKCLEHAMPLIDFRILSAERKYDLTKTDDKRLFVKEALSIVREAESDTEREELFRMIAQKTQISLGALHRDYENAGGQVPAQKTESAPPRGKLKGDKWEIAARFILAACLFEKDYAKNLDLSSLTFDKEEHKKIVGFIQEGRSQGKIRPSGLFDILGTDGEISEILDLNFDDNLDGDAAARFFQDSVKALRKKGLQQEIDECTQAYGKAETDEEKQKILLRLGELTKLLNRPD